MIPKISIVLPAYGHENYVEKAVLSLLRQSEKNIEIIAVDDGSPDQTGNILDRLALTDSRLRVFHKKNGGVVSALNYGLDQATGEWVATCASDDMVPTRAYEQMLRAADNADVVIGEFTEFNDQGLKTRVRLQSKLGNQTPFELLFAMPTTWNKLFRRDLLEREHIRYPEVSVCEDLIFLARVAAINPRCVFTPHSIYFYRNNTTRSQSLSHIYTKKMFHAHIEGRKLVHDICMEANIMAVNSYVYHDSLPYLANFLQKIDPCDLTDALCDIKEFLSQAGPYLDPVQFEQLFYVSYQQFVTYTALEYEEVLRRISPEEQIIKKYLAGELGLHFAWQCVNAWFSYRKHIKRRK